MNGMAKRGVGVANDGEQSQTASHRRAERRRPPSHRPSDNLYKRRDEIAAERTVV